MVQRITEVNGLRAGRDLVNLVKGKIRGWMAASPKMIKTRLRRVVGESGETASRSGYRGWGTESEKK